jgi:hypothetical protein
LYLRPRGGFWDHGGYTSEQTYDATASFTPDTDHAHLNAIAAEITDKTFFIDMVSRLTVETRDALTNAVISDVPYHMLGTKKTGTDALGQTIYVLDADHSTDAGGSHVYDDLVWDSYTISIDGATTGYDIAETNLTIPLTVNPGSDQTLTMKLVPHTPYSLHLTVMSAAGEVLPDVAVQVAKPGYDQTEQTGISGQAFFSDLPGSGEYTVTVTASGYVQSSQQVQVDGTTRIQVPLATS